MTKKEVVDVLYGEVAEFLKDKGFRYIKSKGIIRKDTNEGFQEIVFVVNTDYPGFQVSFGFSTRIDAIQEIANKYFSMTPEGLRNSSSMIISCGYWFNKGEERFDNMFKFRPINTPEDARKVATITCEFLVETGLEFLNRYSTLEGLCNGINYNKDILRAFGPSPFLPEILSGIISAWLLERSDFDDIVEYWKKNVKENYLLNKIEELVKDLKEQKR